MRRCFTGTLLVGCLAAALAGCSPALGASTLDPEAQANAEATTMLQNARATAIIAQARAQATAMAEGVTATAGAPKATAVTSTRATIDATSQASAAPAETPNAETTALPQVVLIGVSIVPDSGLIQVEFKAAPAISNKWQYWNVYVIDEASGTIYNDIPDAPLIGRLFSRPPSATQLGYVMFRNTDGKLHTGDVVTVVLGDFKQEHVLVQ